MIEMQTIRRVTIYGDSSLKDVLIQQCLALGSTGYTLVECRGKGEHDTVDDPFAMASRVRIEMIVQPPVAEKIMEHLHTAQFKRFAVSACVETVQVPVGEHY